MAALALLAVALWRVLLALAAGTAPAVHVALDGSEPALTRDSLAALARSGVRVSWSGELAPTVAMVEPGREPTGGARLSVASSRGVVIADSLGVLDSLGAGGGTLIAAAIRGSIGARSGATVARVVVPEPAEFGRVLVIGRVGWESKFVLAALEEAGWETDARLRLADTIDVAPRSDGAAAGGGVAAGLGADRYAAVVVLDGTAAASAGAIVRYVQRGGGVVLAGDGAALPDFRAIAPARVLRTDPPRVRSFAGVDPLLALPLSVLGQSRTDAVLLDRHDGRLSAAARREGAGRVLQAGFAETWRWRMEGDPGGAAAHRAYWSGLVGRASATRELSSLGEGSADGAPLAATIAALGPSTSDARGTRPVVSPLPLWLGALILALLTAEWASRRTRGLH